MTDGRLPTLDEAETIELNVASHSLDSSQELRVRVQDSTSYSRYRAFSLVFSEVGSFTASDDLSGVYFCRRGPSLDGRGLIFEFETREVVPTEGRAVRVEVSGSSDAQILFGKTICEVKARVVAATVTVAETDE
jgi:hypothetical protein